MDCSFLSDSVFLLTAQMKCIIELAHDKTYNKTFVTSKDSDQHVHPPSIARVPTLDSLDGLEGTCD